MFGIKPISGMIKGAVKEVREFVDDEIERIEKGEAKLEPVMKKINQKKMAAFIKDLTDGTATDAEASHASEGIGEIIEALKSIQEKASKADK